MVTEDKWTGAMQALINRRASGSRPNPTPEQGRISDYAAHLRKVHIGRKVLDVGCGSQTIKDCLPYGHAYLGIDPFPVDKFIPKIKIEDAPFNDGSFDTVICFAVLDGVHDLSVALDQIKRIAGKNVVILTLLDIEPDQYHTHKITRELLLDAFESWKVAYEEAITDRVSLFDFHK